MATPINNNTTSLQDLLAKANALPEAGTKLPALTAPGAAADLREGKQLIEGDGNVVDGSMPDVEVPTAEQLLLNSKGTIYATVTQSAGYTPGGTTTTQLDLPVQEGKTVTPTKSKQVAVNAGRWCTESIEVDAIPEEYIVPSGTLNVTANGTHDVTGYASVNVAVPAEDLTAVLNEQDALITELEAALEGKAGGGEEPSKPEQEKTLDVTENGTYNIVPDDGYTMSKATVTVNVPNTGGGGGTTEGYCRVGVVIATATGISTSYSRVFVEETSGFVRRVFGTVAGGMAMCMDTNSNVKCGSLVMVYTQSSATAMQQVTFDSLAGAELYSQNSGVAVFKITAAADGYVTIQATGA